MLFQKSCPYYTVNIKVYIHSQTKCVCYWPEQVDSIQEFGQGIMVKLLKQEFYHGYSCKTFSLQNVNQSTKYTCYI